MEYTAHYDSPLGGITLASDGEALTGLWFDGQKYFGEALSPVREPGNLPAFERAFEWLDAYFDGRDPGFTPPIHLKGTPFRRAVWSALLEIPYGQVTTYGALAEALGGTSPRAVGAAVGHNPLSLVVPCHRVVGANGALTGYAGGIERKRRLLEMEGAKVSGK